MSVSSAVSELLDDAWQDLRHASRIFRRSPAFAAAGVLTIALGIGANSAVFSAVNAVLLRAPPYPDPERLVMLWGDCARCSGRAAVEPGNYSDWKARSRSFETMAAVRAATFNVAGEDEPERVSGVAVTAEFFRTIGVDPLLGRGFLPGEDAVGAPPVAVMGSALWRRRFGAAAALVGTTIRLNGRPHTLVGVMPPGFVFPRPNEMPAAISAWLGDDPEIWVPLAMTPEEAADRSVRSLLVVGRIDRSISRTAAQQEMHLLARRLAREHPATSPEGDDVRVVPIRDQVAGETRGPLFLMMGAVAFVLVIACVNVANLSLARGTDRLREMAVRSALGAGPGRLVRQLLMESLLLAIVGGAVGLGLASAFVNVVRATAPTDIPRIPEMGLDVRVVVVTIGLTVVTGLAFGILPALRLSRPDLRLGTRPGARTAVPTHRRLRHALVVVELALSLVLVIGTGLMLQSLSRLYRVDLQFEPDRVLTMNVTPPEAGYPDLDRLNEFYGELYARIEAVAGIEAVGGIAALPLTGHRARGLFDVVGRAPDPDDVLMASYQVAGHDALVALGVPLLAGRMFDARDVADALPVAMINQAFAERFFPDEDPVGQRLRMWQDVPAFATPPLREIVGVIGDVKQASLRETVDPQIILAQTQTPWRSMSLAVKSTLGEAALIDEVRRRVRAIDDQVPISDVVTMDALVERSAAEHRFYSTLLTVFGVAATLLALIGVYGVVAYSTSRRTAELGIRIALGARKRNVVELVLAEGFVLITAGVTLGTILALSLTRLLSRFLFEVSPTDVGTFVGFAVLLAGMALLACYVPARRAARLDVTTALRAN